jgi:hypothetical protein
VTAVRRGRASHQAFPFFLPRAVRLSIGGDDLQVSQTGRSSTYERFEHDGSKTLTHVFWTEEATANCPSCDHRYDR